jgi:hypothetical protein
MPEPPRPLPRNVWLEVRGLLANSATGILKLRLDHGRVVDHAFVPAPQAGPGESGAQAP